MFEKPYPGLAPVLKYESWEFQGGEYSVSVSVSYDKFEYHTAV